ncbi:hypothetical protein [Parasphingorhabdus sp.]|uniref:hypothetical protein n=1 Tax=Parasphingorhabdus sp. TaxID=2709688 RepID=UPI0030028DD2
MARQLWLEAHDYAVKLLRSGEDPWLQPDSIGIFCDEAIRLLGADRLLLPLAPLLDPLLGDAGGAGQDRADALDEAVSQAKLLDTIGRGVTALAVSAGSARVVPVLPGASAFGGSEADALDMAAMALGDILRAIATVESGIVGLAEPEQAGLEEAGLLFRIAEHAGCAIALLGQQDHQAADYCFPAADRLSPLGKGACQTIGEDGFSADGQADPAALHVRVRIAAGTPPEFVLQRLSALRAGEAG